MWLKVDFRMMAHPASLQAGNAAMGLWMRAGCWLARFPQENDVLPDYMVKRWGTRKEIARLVDAELLEPCEGGYRFSRRMDVCGSGLHTESWGVDLGIRRRDSINADLRDAVYERDGYACVTCSTTENLSLDHIYPWSRGGEDSFENLQTMCRSCNSSKGARV